MREIKINIQSMTVDVKDVTLQNGPQLIQANDLITTYCPSANPSVDIFKFS